MSDDGINVFIAVGSKGKQFTLRKTLSVSDDGEQKTAYLFNLGLDFKQALEKAVLYSERKGLPLIEPNENKLNHERTEIQRTVSDKYSIEWTPLHQSMLSKGIFPVGKYRDFLFTELPVDYLMWLRDTLSDFEEGGVMEKAAKMALAANKNKKLVKANGSKWGEKGKTDEVDVTVISTVPIKSRGRQVFLVKMVTDEGATLVSFLYGFYFSVGDQVRVGARVTGYQVYKGEQQTKVADVTVLTNYTNESRRAKNTKHS